MEYEYEYDVQQDLKALGDSVTVIDQILAIDEPTEKDLGTLDRNVRHIEIMVAKDHIKNSGEKLKPFYDAVNAARQAYPDVEAS